MRTFQIAYVFVLLAAVSSGQQVSCSLNGTVTDTTGAVFPGVQIVAASEGTGFTRETVSNPSGFFSFPDLIPGTYTLRITSTGFKKYEQTGIVLGSGEQRSVGSIQLELGATNESVTVTAEAASVQLGSSERAGVLSGQDLSEMAIRGRDFLDAVGLLPGVVDVSDGREAPGADSIGGIHIGGGRTNQKNVTVDGITNLDTGSNNSMHNTPSMDSIAEVRVLQSNFAAEYGRNSGGAITVITKGGGKRFRGSAGYFNRHENYSANDYFNNRNGIPRSPYRYNIASYTFGGPIYIPGKFNRDKSKLFFFWSQEFQVQKVLYGNARTVRVPTLLERQGDFSQTYDVNARLIPVYDPLAGTNVLFPDRKIPASRFNPIGQKILNFFPEPNFTDPAPTRLYQWNYISALSGGFNRHSEVLRIDYTFRKNMQTYLRWNNGFEDQAPPYGLWVNGNINFPLTPVVYQRPGRGATLFNTITISPTFFSETIFGVSQNKLYYFPQNPEAVSRKSTGINIPQWYPDNNPDGLIPNMTFSSVPNYANPSMSDGTPYYNANTIFSLVQNFSKIWQTHTIKFGGYLERTRKDQSANATTRGAISFDRDRNSPYDTNYAYATALLGYFSTYAEATARPQGQYRFSNIEWFIQDAWRVKRNFMLDYGVRFYANAPQYDARQGLSSFFPGLYDPATAPVLLRPAYDPSGKKAAFDPINNRYYSESLIGTYVPGYGDMAPGMGVGGVNGIPRGVYSAPPIQLAPRFGFAWDPFRKGRTSIRGGGGVFFDRVAGNPSMGLLANPPTIYRPSVYYGTIDGIASAGGRGILAPTATINSLIGHHAMPTTYNFSLNVQQLLTRDLIVEGAYVGSLARHGLWQRNINPVPLFANHVDTHPENRDPTAPTRPLPPNFLRPYQGVGNVNLYEFASNSSYHSFQLSASQRFRRGITLGLAYTFSKALGTASTDTTVVSSFFNPRERNYGPLTFDRTHVLSFRYNVKLPRPGKSLNSPVLGYFTDNWELSGITRIQSGAPFTPGYNLVSGTDITGTPNESARPVVIDPAAPPEFRFGAPARAEFGDVGANILRHPGMNNWDISLYRTIAFREGRNLQIRLETYNTFNHTQFLNVSTSARFQQQGATEQIDPLFLQPTSSRSPRRVQLAVRINF
ncbi:MAG: Plug and carboxypeptidase regulatory-like domain-containing protein [Bryobacter sp.]|nr:Plug and carboxypeptidase regulatory-like domain-containing protein [Bryobacter sp.]